MKKYFVLFGSLSLIVFIVMLFSGCSSSNIKEKITDFRYGVYDCSNDNLNVIFVYGLRENPYKYDGIVNNNMEFGIISVEFKDEINETDKIEYVLDIDDQSYYGNLEKNPYSTEYMANIGKICQNDSKLSITILINGIKQETLNLENKTILWKINSNQALEIGINSLKDKINEFEKNNQNYEIHVKILTQQKTNFGKYYWIVSIISKTEKHNVIFSTQSEEILVKN